MAHFTTKEACMTGQESWALKVLQGHQDIISYIKNEDKTGKMDPIKKRWPPSKELTACRDKGIQIKWIPLWIKNIL